AAQALDDGGLAEISLSPLTMIMEMELWLHAAALSSTEGGSAPGREEALRRSPALGQPVGKTAAKEAKKKDRPAGEPDQQPKAQEKRAGFPEGDRGAGEEDSGREAETQEEVQAEDYAKGGGGTDGGLRRSRGTCTADDDGEIIAGLPTLHEWPAEGDPGDAVLLCAVYDDRTGEALNEDQVKEGRAKEMKQMETFGVKSDISYQEAKAKGLRLVRSRWVDIAKEITGKPGVRSRLVAQEVNTYKREDVSMGTPPLRVHRTVISHAATAKPGQSVSKKLVARYDVSVAFFHAEDSERIGVVPPASEGTPDTIWELHKVKTADGYSELLLCPNTYYLAGGDVALSCHGDDVLASGEASELDKMDEIMKQNYEVKVLSRIGDPKHGGETDSGRHLGRVIKWTGSGFTWEADPKYSEQVVEELKLKGCRSVDTPSSKATGAGNRFVDRELEKERADVFRRVAGYIATYPVEKWHFELQKTPRVLESFSDSDWATDKKSRKSVSSTYQRFGKHLIDCCCGRQSLVALSSGEAGFYAMIKTAAEGKLTHAILEHFGWRTKHTVLSDSSAARSMAQRVGCGKVKHLSLKEMWIQQTVRDEELSTGKVDTSMNLADLGTKALEASRLESLVKQLPLERGMAAAVLACCVSVAHAVQEGSRESQDDSGDLGVLMVYFFAMVGLVFTFRKLSLLCLKGWAWLYGGVGTRGLGPSTGLVRAAMEPGEFSSTALSPVELGRAAAVDTGGGNSKPRRRTGNEERVSRERASGRGAESSPAYEAGVEESLASGQSCAGRLRVVRDTLSLLTVAELQTRARLEGEEQPTTKQLRYVLYFHARRAQCKIKYENLRRKSIASDPLSELGWRGWSCGYMLQPLSSTEGIRYTLNLSLFGLFGDRFAEECEIFALVRTETASDDLRSMRSDLKDLLEVCHYKR
ncbi:unnamed protein product, partial [Symbiodinium necroappetens]